MTNLYEISQELRTVLSEGEINEEALNAVCIAFNDKALALSHYIRGLQSDENEVQLEIDRLRERQEYFKARSERLKKYLLDNMIACNIEKIDLPVFTIKTRLCPESVSVRDDWVIPEQYYIEKIEKRLDKERIRRELKAGVIIDGCELARNIKLEIK